MGSQMTLSMVVNLTITLLRLFFIELPIFILLHPLRRLHDDRLALKDQIPFFLIRRTNYLFNPATTRFVTDIGLPETILDSPRYKPYSHALFQEFKHHNSSFRGRWIVQGSFSKPEPPEHSDIVIFYLHGGGYFSSSAASYLLFLLRVAETLIRGGRTVSIFALEYDLAPENPFPTQLKQAGAAYRWLIASESEGGAGVDSKRLLLAGDSAGGHLCLSLLVDLHQPYPSADTVTDHTPIDVEKPLGSAAKPAVGLVLMSPWLSLWHQPHSFRRNRNTDVLTGWHLLTIAKWFIGPNWKGIWPPKSSYLEFLDLEPGIDWQKVLPRWVWVSAGKNEILYDDIRDWYVARKKDCIGIDVAGEIDLNESHVYAWLETVDYSSRKRFLEQKFDLTASESPSDGYAAVERVGRVILSHIPER